MTMDDNLAWKSIFIGTIFSLLILGFVYYLIAPQDSPFFNEEKMTKIAEFSGARVSGRKDGKRVWQFLAKEGWTTKDREITYLYNVKEGKIFKDDIITVSNLVAPFAKTYRHSEIVEAFGYPEGKKSGKSLLACKINFSKIANPKSSESREWTTMIADFIKHIPEKEVAEIKGDISFSKRDSTIHAQKIDIQFEKDLADVTDNVWIQRKDGTLKANTIKYHSAEERIEAFDNIYLDVKEGKIKTKLNANKAIFYMDMSKPMTLIGSVEVAQGKKLAVAKNAIYSQKSKNLRMTDQVKAIFEKAQAILKDDTVKKLKNKEAQEILKKKTVLTSDILVFSTKTGDATASGSVFVVQKGREAKADNAVYDESRELLTLTGNVFMKKKDEWVKAKKVIISVRRETFEAYGAVEAEFKF